jgi:REP element-mobilizing transposase RayT
MIVGYHVIFGAYGFWLPNDPRGSWSEFVGSWDLARYGKATKTDARRSVAHQRHDREARLAAKRSLKRPAVKFSGIQARAVGRGFAKYSENSGLRIWACAILPDHIHFVFDRTKLDAEQIVIQLKGEATRSLNAEGIHPFQATAGARPPKCFAQKEWAVYLDAEDVPRAIQYVENNPIKEGLPRQHWPFVVPHEG